MGQPNNPCFKPSYPYLEWQTSTTTTTTISLVEEDYFILPVSGLIDCPTIYLDTTSENWEFPNSINTEKNIFICNSVLYDPNPCIIEVDKYIKVADIDIDTNRCSRYKIILSNILAPTTTTTTTTATPCEVFDCTGNINDPIVSCPPNTIFDCDACECIPIVP
jgi:hypothetical protein